MKHSIRKLGDIAVFLLPSVKLKHQLSQGVTVEQGLHAFLLENFDGYTISNGTVYSFALDLHGHEHQGEYREFKVAFQQSQQMRTLASYLAKLAHELDEPSIYIEIADDVCLIYPTP